MQLIVAGMLDPAVAYRSMRELAAPGPIPPAHAARELVRDLHEAAQTSVDLVFASMRLPRDWEDEARARVGDTSVCVVDRLGWGKANAQTLARIVERYVPAPTGPFAGIRARSQRVTASVELGGALAVLAGRVFGQFDVLGADSRLLLVAPNIVEAERRMGVTPRDFRLWVALHETTHRLQFAAAPWLRGYLLERIGKLISLQPEIVTVSGTLGAVQDGLGDVIAGIREGRSLLDLLARPQTRTTLDEITAVMSLLEGHADVIMDTAGRSAIPTVRTIRRIFDAGRTTGEGMRAFLAELIGIGDKLEQYEWGAEFVRTVVRARGHAGLQPIFASPAGLPTLAELSDPTDWLERVAPGV